MDNTLLIFLNAYKYPLVGLATFASFAGFVFLTKRFYFNGGRCASENRLDGKTAIVTGANTGIGYFTALDFARRGARVILACRDLNRANQAAKKIRSKSGNGNVQVELLDLASLDSVRSFSKKIIAQESRIDLLVCNAGMNKRYFYILFHR